MISKLKIQTQPSIFLTKPISNHRSFVACLNPKFRLKREFEQRKEVVLERMEILRKFSIGCFGKEPETRKIDREKKVEIESVRSVHGGEDIFSAGEKVGPEHLVIMVNGIVGSAADWKYAAEQFVRQLPQKVIVHRSESNYAKLTLEGVDLMGERLAEEVLDVVQLWPNLRKISFVAHSLGGLVARYAIGRLYGRSSKTETSISSNSVHVEHLDDDSTESRNQSFEATIASLQPINFITFATPHLGSRGHKQLPLLCGLSFLEKRASETAHLIAGMSGKHLFLTDNDGGNPPLLIRMVNDCGDLKFMSALRSFKRRVAYSNVNHDFVVGWRTSSIRRQHELPPSNLLVKDKKYPHIVFVDYGMDNKEASSTQTTLTLSKNKKEMSPITAQTYQLEEEMIRGLTQVPWERVDVSFHSKQRFIAHNTILVKSYDLTDGADVVRHMIDNFVL